MSTPAKFKAVIGAGAVFAIVVCGTLFGAGLKGNQNIKKVGQFAKSNNGLLTSFRQRLLTRRRQLMTKYKCWNNEDLPL
jgi:hypothetical protein